MTLQEQINSASSGATITLPDGSEHVGNFIFPRSITIQGKATLITPNAAPAIDIPLQARGVNFIDTAVKSSAAELYDLVRIGTWQNSVLADCPTDITFNRVDIYGQPGQKVQRGIRADGANVSLLNSKVREIHLKGADTQAFFAGNGPGPFKIFDSYLEASGENIMFGGADASIPNLVPSDIEIRRCKIVKPLAWRGVWSAKNLLELKNARRVTIDGNILENSWGDAQIGYGVLFTVRNQDGGNPWAVVEDVSFTNNSLLNVAGGFQLLGSDYLHPSGQSSRLKIANNIIKLAQNSELGPNGRLILIQGFNDVQFINNEANPDHTFLILTGENAGTPILSRGLVYQNNLVSYGQYGLFGDGGKPSTYYAPDCKVTGNVVYGGANPQQLPGNAYMPTKPDPVPAGVGVDMAALQAAQAGAVITPPPPPPPPVPEYRDVSFIKDTESVRTQLYQKQFAEGYAAWQEASGNKIRFRKFR